jgi:predicted RNA-binding Zn ribbon-like protein
VDWFVGVAGLDEASARRLRASDALERAQALRATIQLREALHTLLTSSAVDESTSVAAVMLRAARALASASAEPRLPLQPTVVVHAAGDIVHWLALEAFALVTSPDVARVKTCEGDGCGWLFVDRSRNRTRRWCDSADCGNRTRVRRHYQRHRSEHGTDPT